MPRDLKAACIGFRHGHARSLAETFRQLEGVEVVAFCEETEPEKMESQRELSPDARFYTSLDELLAKEDFDVACAALPANEMPGIGIKLANADKHFLMEKQFARNAAEMKAMVDAIQEAGVKVLAHYPWRCHAAVVAMKQHLDAGDLGRPLALHAEMITAQVRPGMRDPNGIAYQEETEGGGILHMLGGHWLEALRFLMGCEVSSVSAVCRPVVGNMSGQNMEDVSVVAMEFGNGVVGNLHAGYLQSAKQGYGGGLTLWGTEGVACWEAMGAPSLKVSSRNWEEPERVFEFDLPSKEGVYGGLQWLFDLVDDFMNCIREDRAPAVTEQDGFKVLQIIDAAYESSNSGRRVDLCQD